MHDGAGLHDVVAVTWCDTVLGGDREHDAVRLRVREDDGEDAALCVTVREALAEGLEVAVHVCAWVPVSDRVAVGVIIAETEAVLVALPVLCVVAVDVADNKGVCVYDAVKLTVSVIVLSSEGVSVGVLASVTDGVDVGVGDIKFVMVQLHVRLGEALDVCPGVDDGVQVPATVLDPVPLVVNAVVVDGVQVYGTEQDPVRDGVWVFATVDDPDVVLEKEWAAVSVVDAVPLEVGINDVELEAESVGLNALVGDAVHVCALVVVMVAEIDVESAGVDVRDGVGFVERVRVREPDEVVVGVIAGVPVAVSEVVTVE